jgi:hypothetical protein
MLSRADRRQYLSEAFHTISQPLTGLQCGLELAVAIPRGPEEYRRRIGEALEITSRLRSLTAALRELVEADDIGEDARVVEVDGMLAALHERAISLAALHKASVKVLSSGDLNLVLSESKFSRMLLFLVEQVLAENSEVTCKAQRVNQNVEIVIENLNGTKQNCDQEKKWQDQVDAIRLSAAENYIRTLGGELRTSESRCIIQLPLFRQDHPV